MDQSVQKALKKAKRKQWLKIIVISFFVCMVLLISFYRVGNYFAAKSTQRLHEILFLQNQIMQPNIEIDSQVTSNSSVFGGNIITNRSKNIDGYVVPWSTLTSSYSWIRTSINFNELVPGFHSDEKNQYEYDKQTKQKYATFYNPNVADYYDGVQNQLADVVALENHVAEVAISFNEPMTFAEVRANMPDNLNIVWLYMLSRRSNEEFGPSGTQIYGYADDAQSEEGFTSFKDALSKYDRRGNIEEIQTFLKENENKAFEEVPVLGVMLTGRTENFAGLQDADFVRGASVGVTTEIVPYIEPIK